MDEGQIHRGRGLVDLIAGKTPTLVDWTTNPTDAANITDGDISTFCTTGDKVIGAGWQYAYIEYDLGDFYNIFATGHGCAVAAAGTSRIYVYVYDGSTWRASESWSVSGGSPKAFSVFGSTCSKVRLCITSTAAATVTPNIREFHVWRL